MKVEHTNQGQRPSLLGWRTSLLGWRPSLLGWRPSLLGCRTSRNLPISRSGPEAFHGGACKATVFQFNAAAPVQWERFQELSLNEVYDERKLFQLNMSLRSKGHSKQLLLVSKHQSVYIYICIKNPKRRNNNNETPAKTKTQKHTCFVS